MKSKNEKFFNNKTYAEILNKLDFRTHLNKMKQKFRNKKIIIYGAGILFDYISDNYDLSEFNIVAIADKRFEAAPTDFYKKFKAIAPNQMKEQKADLILIANTYPVRIKQYLDRTFKNLPPIYFWLNKPFDLYIEEIF